MASVKTGDKAPQFTAVDDSGKRISLADLRGKWVVLFFYPKDDTPGWTIEACSFRDAFPRFEGLDAAVLGISPDSAESHQHFKTKYGLPMTLIVDTDHAIAEAYGVWVEKNTFGVKRMGIARTTFIVDPAGRIAKVFEKVEPNGHGDEVAAAVAAAQKAA